jgi:hypothetical protein
VAGAERNIVGHRRCAGGVEVDGSCRSAARGFYPENGVLELQIGFDVEILFRIVLAMCSRGFVGPALLLVETHPTLSVDD